MKKKRNPRGSAPSSCAPASCPTSSFSRVPRSLASSVLPPLLFVAYFAALCHTVHRAHLSRDLGNHRASIDHRTNENAVLLERRSRAQEEPPNLPIPYQSSRDRSRILRAFVTSGPSTDRDSSVSRQRRAVIQPSNRLRARWRRNNDAGIFSSWPRRRRMPGYCSRWSFWASLFSSDASATVASGGIDRRHRRHRRRSTSTPPYRASPVVALPSFSSSTSSTPYHLSLSLPFAALSACLFLFSRPLLGPRVSCSLFLPSIHASAFWAGSVLSIHSPWSTLLGRVRSSIRGFESTDGNDLRGGRWNL